MGTPELAAVVLARLVGDGHEIRGVLTQPDRPKGRGHRLAASPVKAYALSEGIPVLQPPSLRGEEAREAVRALDPELIVVAAYGKILPKALLDLPPYGAVNVHTSLLPKYRGAAPINWAVLRGERETGVSIMYMAEELDAGDVILQRATPIGDDEDAQALTARLAVLGAEALSEAVGRIAAGTASRTPQDPAGKTLAPMLSRDLSPVDWSRSAHEIHCQVRGLIPWPCATARIGGELLKLWQVEETGETVQAPPGTVVSADRRGIGVACGDGTVLRIVGSQAANGRRMPTADWLRGHPVEIGI